MRVHISEGNMKMGKVPSVSLLPIVTCREDAPCIRECYAQKAIRRRDPWIAWAENTAMALNDTERYFKAIWCWLRRYEPSMFRWHVGGDIPDEEYLVYMKDIATRLPDTKFLVFTKKYDMPFYRTLGNLQVIYSAWPGLEVPPRDGHRVAWLEDDERRPSKGVHMCKGSCDECQYCFGPLEKDVVLRRH